MNNVVLAKHLLALKAILCASIAFFLLAGCLSANAENEASPGSAQIVPYPEAPYIYNETDRESLDQANIFFVAKDGNDANPGTEAQPWLTIQKAANTLHPGQKVYIKTGVYHERVVISKSGLPGKYIIFSAYPGHQTIIDGDGIPPLDRDPAKSAWGGLLHINNASWITVKGLKVRNSASTGIFAEYGDHLIIKDNFTYHTWASGIGVWFGKHIVVSGNETVYACDANTLGSDSEYIQENFSIAGCEDFEIFGNHIHHGGKPSNFGGEGLDIKHSVNGKVYGNIIHDLPKVGIYIDAWDAHSGNIAVYNNVSYGNRSWGMALAAENNGTLENVRVFNNLIYDNDMVGIGVEGGKGWGIGSHHYLKSIYIYNNTVVGNGLVSKWSPGIRVFAPEGQDISIANNVLFGNFSDLVATENPAPANLAIGKNLCGIDPLFVDSAHRNFRLQSSSPAIDIAIAPMVPAIDFDGIARPKGLGFDMGAFEF